MASAKQKRKKFTRTVSGRKRIATARKKTGKRSCILCGKQLHGVPHGRTKAQVSGLGKSEKKPSVIFGGILCSSCRRLVIDEAAMLRQKSKSIQEIDLSRQKLVTQAMERMK
ncbi:MAG: 50S ribosomal protein L34e [Candidatus Diapherotrites archaeon]|uniref:50S ribosomal protein L34e n=1 Tax=Candidatus Iainarchaeum sp. TaxID=3101447 RepID=A0A8T4KTC4_9ARCH|nr:50S ribosomal protein L34e [Candidatus Diapherotrites archaeon]